MAGAITVLIIVAASIALSLLVAAERLVKLRRRARQRRQMAYRLSKAAARAEVAERKRKAAVVASAQLTSVIPAINQPKPTLDGVLRQAHRTRTLRQPGSPGTGPHSAGPQRPGAGTRRQNTGPQRRPGTAAPARPRCQEQQRRLPGVQRPSDQPPSDQPTGGQAPATPPGGDTRSGR
jgi:hypothetical protein